MSEASVKHLVLVRHGESEGDVRRAMRNQPINTDLAKHPRDEEETIQGHEQSVVAGKWIAKFVLGTYGLDRFDWQYTSPLIRTKQSADSLGLVGGWTGDVRLSERDRGRIQGMTKKQHHEQFPENYQQMLEHPFHWTPPGGESLLRVSMRFSELVNDFMQSSATSGVFMTHRDLLWSAHIPLDHISLDQINDIDTDRLHNGYVAHYTNINPDNGEISYDGHLWKRSWTPWIDGVNVDSSDWTKLES